MLRSEALKLVEEKIQNKNLIKHCLAVETVMRELAKQLGEDEEKWDLTGLLHDIDYEETKDAPDKHSLIGAEILEKLGLDAEIVVAVKVHNEAHGLPRETKMAKALFCVDPLTGLIVAAALVLPTNPKVEQSSLRGEKISRLTVENVLNRYREKGFARGANREHIALCSEIGLDLEEFVKVGLAAMQKIAADLNL